MTDLPRLSPSELVKLMQSNGIRRFYLVHQPETGKVLASHPALQPLADLLEADTRDFRGHEGFFAWISPRTGVLQGAAVHRTARGQAAGGVRYWTYDTVEDWLRDGLRLGQGMTHKNALAGLWWGGGKGVMVRNTGADPSDPAVRREIYEDYGRFMTSLRGCYITAEDVGTGVEDMAAIFSQTRFTTCIPQRLGGSGNPSAPTALGVVRGMEAGLAHLGMGTLEGKTIAMQGLGHVGEPMVEYLVERGIGRLIGSDIDPTREAAIRDRFPELDFEFHLVERGDNEILTVPCDIAAPNATGAVLNADTIPRIQAAIVCGAANNQLAEPQGDDVAIRDAGVVYLPDFLVNRMGIVNCADEQYGYVEEDAAFLRHLGTDWDNSIYNLCLRVLREAEQTGKTTAQVALDLAEERSLVPHPVHGHRGVRIVQSLVDTHWERLP